MAKLSVPLFFFIVFLLFMSDERNIGFVEGKICMADLVAYSCKKGTDAKCHDICYKMLRHEFFIDGYCRVDVGYCRCIYHAPECTEK
ncbi:hypothetical protein LguiA_014617 [Lonicera macranthoides]